MDPVTAENTSPQASASVRNGAEILLDTLVARGVDTIFGYPGGAALPLYGALYAEARLRHVLVRHEQAAVHAAEGYARSTGRLGVVLVTSGPGVGNTMTGRLDAISDSIPVLCISGQVSEVAEANLSMHDADLVICVGARFDDRITGRLHDFSPGSCKSHRHPRIQHQQGGAGRDVPLVRDCGEVLDELLQLLPELPSDRLQPRWKKIEGRRGSDCLAVQPRADVILPQALLSQLQVQLRGRDAIVSTDVGQHRMWAAQSLRFEQPRRWL